MIVPTAGSFVVMSGNKYTGQIPEKPAPKKTVFITGSSWWNRFIDSFKNDGIERKYLLPDRKTIEA